MSVNGFFQTGPYMDRLWKRALRTIPRQTNIDRVLLLGYGAGGTNRLIRKRFPEARITAIEWDPQMVELANRLHLHRPDDLAELRVGDARDVIQTLHGTFDLILFDLYQGKHPSPLLEDPDFLQRLQSLLHPNGTFLVNAFGKPEALETVARFFSIQKRWRYHWNACASFRPFLPPDFLPFHAVPAHVEREISFRDGQTFLRGDGYAGRRWQVGPLGFEMYYTDIEPVIEPNKGPRVIYWQTLLRSDVPKGWFRSPTMPNFRKTGYAPVGTASDYWKTWAPHAQRHRKKWLSRPDAEIRVVDLETFIAAYRHGTLDWMMKRMFIWMLRRKASMHGDLMQYWLAVRPDGVAIAGLCTLDIPETKTSVHIIAFYRPEARTSNANYGLIEYWFQDALAKGWNYLDFDVFRGPGDPRRWNGFSRFKGQFGTRFIIYRNPLMRFAK